jgi:hypothetical protein
MPSARGERTVTLGAARHRIGNTAARTRDTPSIRLPRATPLVADRHRCASPGGGHWPNAHQVVPDVHPRRLKTLRADLNPGRLMPALHTLKPQTVSGETAEEAMATDQSIEEEEETHCLLF